MNICISTTAVGLRIAAALRNKETERAKGMLALAEEMGIHCIVRGKESPEMLEMIMLKESGAERRETYHV